MSQNETYENSAAKAEDNKSSAFTLLFVGVVGIIVIILGIADVLSIHLYGITKYMAYGIMGALFLLFIVMGLVSMKSYRTFAKKAESESSLVDTMKKWSKENLIGKDIDRDLFIDENTGEEEKYFRRTQIMKDRLSHQFMNLKDTILEHFIDEVYDDIFED